jgi:uncharacterized protein (DUF1684 family)
VCFVVLGVAMAAGGASACGGRDPSESAEVVPVEAPPMSVQAWRDTHEEDYRREYVSIAGLHFLERGAYRLGSDPASDIVIDHVPRDIGRLTVTDGTVRYEPVAGVSARQSEAPVTGPVVLKAPEAAPAPEIVIDSVRLVVHESGGRLALRVRDPNAEPATSFRGFSWFPIDDSYRLVGRFIRDESPRELPVLNTFNDTDRYVTEGVVEFTLQGRTLRLRPFTTRPNRFYFVFRDASSGEETYETARFLYSDLLADGTTVLDFNTAYNPPCAFNPYTTCPVPLAENRLPVKILAGERDYAASER